jgi:hypothetical protein
MVLASYNCSLIVQATVIMIINYDCKTFIVQTTGVGGECQATVAHCQPFYAWEDPYQGGFY